MNIFNYPSHNDDDTWLFSSSYPINVSLACFLMIDVLYCCFYVYINGLYRISSFFLLSKQQLFDPVIDNNIKSLIAARFFCRKAEMRSNVKHCTNREDIVYLKEILIFIIYLMLFFNKICRSFLCKISFY